MTVVNTEPMSNFQKATFTLSGEGNFVGYHDPKDTWNGFANPLFPIDSVRAIVELVKEQNALSTDEPQDELTIRTYGGVNYVFYKYAEDGTTEQMPSHLVNNEIVFAVMNHAWCWSVADAPMDSPAVSSEV